MKLMSNFAQECAAVTGGLNWMLRLEGLAVLIAAIIFYAQTNPSSWKIFFLLFFSPDVGLLGYLWGSEIGAISYNIMHTYLTPLLFLAICWFFSFSQWNSIIVIWIAHIGFDRMLGYGLKYMNGFGYTHLGIIKRHF
jgi:hypothetical protein